MKSKRRYWHWIGFRLAFMLTMGVVFLGSCGDTGSDDYRELSDSRDVPTIRLVVDEVRKHGGSTFWSQEMHYAGSTPQWFRSAHFTTQWPYVQVSYHLQSDTPVEHDTFVLVRTSMEGDSFEDRLVVLLASRTQSELFKVSEWYVTDTHIASWKVTWNAHYGKEDWEDWGSPICDTYKKDYSAFFGAGIPFEDNPIPRFIKEKNTTTGVMGCC